MTEYEYLQGLRDDLEQLMRDRHKARCKSPVIGEKLLELVHITEDRMADLEERDGVSVNE